VRDRHAAATILKALRPITFMKMQLMGKWFVVGALAAAPLVPSATAQDGQAGATPATAPTATGGKAGNPAKPAAPADKPSLSGGIEDVLKMVDAGVSKDVIKTYIENSAIDYNLNAADIIALKERAVTDDITTALVKRGAEVRAQGGQAGGSAAVAQAAPDAAGPNSAPPAYAAVNPGYAILDPESHDYWWYYYAYPRTLAYANQRLYSSYPGFGYSSPYVYGYSPALPFRPYPPGAFARPRNPGGPRGGFPLNRNGAFQPVPGPNGQPFGQPSGRPR
jgi:hypothetical protein